MSDTTKKRGVVLGGGQVQPAAVRVASGVPEFSTTLALSLLGVLVVAMFEDVLFFPQGRVLSSAGTDLFHQFVHWRRFGFDQLRQGNLALWNPHIFCGAPFLGGFQSALLYPLNLLFLVLPLGPAINWSIALHVWLAGAFTYLWVRNRGFHCLAGLFAAMIFMFCGPHFLHIYPGHLPNLCTMIWAPLIFLALDRIFAQPSVVSWLLGSFAVAMQILAGHPQYVFYTAVAAAAYACLLLVNASNRTRIVLGVLAMWLGGTALSAAQLLTSLSEASETLRSRGLPYHFAAMFSLPPENLLTLVAPGFFGDMKSFPYWGRDFLWESSLFVSITGLVFAAYGVKCGNRGTSRLAVIMVIVLLVLALGANTPLLSILYHYVPGFDMFRGSVKFAFLAGLFLAMLAANGLDAMIRSKHPPGKVCWVVLVGTGAVCAIAALLLRHGAVLTAGHPWRRVFETIQASGMSYVEQGVYSDPRFIAAATRRTGQSLLWCAATCGGLAALLWLFRFSRKGLWGLLTLGTVELVIFARTSLATFDLARTDFPELRAHLAANPGDYRIFNAVSHNSAMTVGAADIWGSDPGVLRRYAEFVACTQSISPDETTQDISISGFGPLYRMLRARFTFRPGENGAVRLDELAAAMPQLQLVSRCRVIKRRDYIFAALTNAAFNPREEVILETTPHPPPQPAPNPGLVNLLDSSTDHLTIEARVESPAILLITDAYAKGWRARPLPGSNQRGYQILPADYCLRAIPLEKGYHRLRVEYRPTGFAVGTRVSLASLALYAGVMLSHIRRQKKTQC